MGVQKGRLPTTAQMAKQRFRSAWLVRKGLVAMKLGLIGDGGLLRRPWKELAVQIARQSAGLFATKIIKSILR